MKYDIWWNKGVAVLRISQICLGNSFQGQWQLQSTNKSLQTVCTYHTYTLQPSFRDIRETRFVEEKAQERPDDHDQKLFHRHFGLWHDRSHEEYLLALASESSRTAVPIWRCMQLCIPASRKYGFMCGFSQMRHHVGLMRLWMWTAWWVCIIHSEVDPYKPPLLVWRRRSHIAHSLYDHFVLEKNLQYVFPASAKQLPRGMLTLLADACLRPVM